VNRAVATFKVDDIENFKRKMLGWANRFNIFLFLDSCGYKDKYSSEEWILAVDAIDHFSTEEASFSNFQQWLDEKQDWVFGNINYDLKNEIEHLSSSHADHISFSELFFFIPAIIIRKKGAEVEVLSLTTQGEEIISQISNLVVDQSLPKPQLNVQPRIKRTEYLKIIQQLRQHILKGDCYEINFCQEFFAENATIDPFAVYQQLSSISPTPFSGFYKVNDKFLLCASPERFLKKSGSKIISQPIKGTVKRNLNDAVTDEQLKQQLRSSQKDQSENVMVVDLVRNDLSKFCNEASVHVEELYGIYSFPQVHQMISTVVGDLKPEISFTDILKATFPMGSMTGAPKIRVMQLVEQYERSKRGIYSGSIGYINPKGDFDFNVVIRSIMYNAANKYLSYQVGGGITFYSDPEKEYEECLLKAEAIKKVLL
jgi:para-aminobenzoate synthetase component 1